MAFANSLSVFLVALQSTFFFTNGYPSNPISIGSSIPIPKEMPVSCKNMAYCSDKTGYPFDLVDELLTKNPLNLKVIAPMHPEIGQRGSVGESYAFSGCFQSSVNEEPIYYIVDEHKDLRIVLQSENFFKQIIPIQECSINTPVRAAFADDEIYTGELFCQNLKLNYNFLVLNKTLNGIELVQNVGGLPVGCVTRSGTRV